MQAVCYRKAAGEAQKAEQQVVNVALVAGHMHERVRARQTPQVVQAGLVYIDLRPKQQPAQRSKPCLSRMASLSGNAARPGCAH